MNKQMNARGDSEILKALGHPVRLKIVKGLLGQNECNVNKIVAALGVPQSTASQHLGILRNFGIIQPRREGVRICYRICDPRISAIVKALGSPTSLSRKGSVKKL